MDDSTSDDTQMTAVQHMQSWLSACDEQHTCRALTLDRPSWLVDTVECCIVPGSNPNNYVALSYTWQESQGSTSSENQEPFRLLEDNLKILTQPGALRNTSQSPLPKVILDAMELTNCLGQRYLWVDRLCITQDQEIATMFEVMRMDQVKMGKESLDISGSNSQQACYLFSNETAFWQCEGATWDMDFLSPGKILDQTVSATSELRHMREFSVPSYPDFGLYMDLICPYNGRKLTDDKDGLSACLGILNRLAPSFPGGFIQGLPIFFLDYALLWQPLKSCYRRTSTSKNARYLPSWAWCGWECFVNPWSFQASFCLDSNDSLRKDKAGSWKLQNLVTWEASTSARGSDWLEETSLTTLPRVVLRNLKDEFSGLIRVTGKAECKKGTPMELVANASPKDMSMWFEGKVFYKSQYCNPGNFYAEVDRDGWRTGFLKKGSREDPHRYEVVTEGDYEDDLILPDGRRYDEFPQDEAVCEFYNVLWVRRENGIAHRVDCGRIIKDRWRQNDPEKIKIVLN
ncbi:hypothetical protein EAF00_011239 [Botryotinia globosa]|nr:hypothetical protein EAF00_011239 [Botryotinia globosa]